MACGGQSICLLHLKAKNPKSAFVARAATIQARPGFIRLPCSRSEAKASSLSNAVPSGKTLWDRSLVAIEVEFGRCQAHERLAALFRI